MSGLTVTILLPMCNAALTVTDTLRSIVEQGVPFQQLVVVDNCSTDGTQGIVREFIERHSLPAMIIQHEVNLGLAKSYNDGILASTGDLVVIVHQDVIVRPGALKLLLAPFQEDAAGAVVAATHVVDHPYDLWKSYGFWQKCLFARLVRRKLQGLDGKFDCFRRSVLMDIGMFDDLKFKSAGEDGDMIVKLRKRGRIALTDAEIIHLHTRGDNFGLRQLLHKHAQYAEAQGALLRIHGVPGVEQFIHMFFREFMALALLVPGLNILCAPAVLLYAFLYTKEVYKSEWRDPRIVLLPFVNIAFLYVSLWHSVKGCLHGRQICNSR